jgi:hypothetical protein
MTNFPEKIASALMESIMAAFHTETADLQRLADEVDAAGQDVEKIGAAIERHGNRRTQAMETIRTMLNAEVAEFNASWALGKPGSGALRQLANDRFERNPRPVGLGQPRMGLGQRANTIIDTRSPGADPQSSSSSSPQMPACVARACCSRHCRSAGAFAVARPPPLNTTTRERSWPST